MESVVNQTSPSWRSRSAASVSVRTGVPGTRSTGCRFHSSVIRAPHALETESRRSLIRAGRRCHVGRVMDRSAVVQPSRERVQLPRVLFVEDERELGELLERLLEEEGFAVDLAADGHAALHLGLTRQYELLLIDRGLPAIVSPGWTPARTTT